MHQEEDTDSVYTEDEQRKDQLAELFAVEKIYGYRYPACGGDAGGFYVDIGCYTRITILGLRQFTLCVNSSIIEENAVAKIIKPLRR